MKFDSNRAWREATASASANREMLLALAGVFFLLPGFASVLFLSDFQADMMANFGNPAAAERIMAGMTGPVVGFWLVSFLLQAIGYLAMLALPTVIGAALLVFSGYILAIVILTLLAAALGSVANVGALAGILVAALLATVIYVMVKLSLTLPVIVIENVKNPGSALVRSWRLTKGNSMRLLVFYLLLGLAYLVIVMVIGMVSMSAVALVAGQGKISLMIGGLISGIIGAAASALLTSVLAAIHRQLAGPSPETISTTFE
jgi:hypothetical protein